MANYGYKGWIKLWREEMHNPMYFEEPFTKWQAWIDLCMLADDKETVKTSLKALKNRWLWGSTKKVRNYLETLSETDMATVKFIPQKGTLIRINAGFCDDKAKHRKKKKETVKETVSETEESLLREEERVKEARSGSPLNTLEEYRRMNEELDDDE